MRAMMVVVMGLALGCGSKDKSDKPAPQPEPRPATATGQFSPAFSDCGGKMGAVNTDFHAAFDACAPLVGTGPCRDAWTAMSSDGKYPEGLVRIIDACAKQHCAALGNKPRACSGPPPAGAEIPVWTELHAAIMNTLFGDDLKVTPEIIEMYESLPAKATVADYGRVISAISSIDRTKASVDGRATVFGMTARLLGAVFFEPAAALTMQRPLP